MLISGFQACYQLVHEELLILQILFVKPTWMWPEIMVSRVLGGISHWKVLSFGIIHCRLDFTVCLACILLWSKYCLYSFWIYWEVAWEQISRVLRCPDQQRILPVLLTQLFSRGTSIVSQESSSSDVEIEVQSPQFIQPSTSQAQLLCNPCLCHILKGQRWTGLWMIACTIDFSSESWSVKTC